jgi:hypothetical protein
MAHAAKASIGFVRNSDVDGASRERPQSWPKPPFVIGTANDRIADQADRCTCGMGER